MKANENGRAAGNRRNPCGDRRDLRRERLDFVRGWVEIVKGMKEHGHDAQLVIETNGGGEIPLRVKGAGLFYPDGRRLDNVNDDGTLPNGGGCVRIRLVMTPELAREILSADGEEATA